MTISEYLRIARKRWQIVAILTAAGVLVGALITFLTPREYEATSTLYISAQGGDANSAQAYQGGLLSEQRVRSYVELVTTTRVAEEVAGRLNGVPPAQEILSSLAASSQEDSVLINVTATRGNPAQAAAISNATADVFTSVVAEIERPANSAQPAPVVARVVEPALPPAAPVWPDASILLSIGLVLGAMAGTAIAIAIEVGDNRVRSAEVLSASLGAPTVGEVALDPELREGQTRITRNGSVAAESLRELRTNFEFLNVDGSGACVVISSAVPEEGKSTISTSLARLLAAAGRTVLLLDADLRRPRVAAMFGLDGTVGLTTLLRGRVSFSQAVQRIDDSGLYVVASGASPPNPSELVSSARMEEILTEARDNFDVVLIDVPPLLPVTDAAAVASKCDGVVVVCRANSTTAAQVTEVRSVLERAGARCLGGVLNMAARERRGEYQYYANPETDLVDHDETAPRHYPHAASRGDVRPSPSPRAGR